MKRSLILLTLLFSMSIMGCGSTSEPIYSDWKIIKDPTCTEKGIKVKTCLNYENTEGIYEDIDPLGHDILVVESLNPSCTQSGCIHYACSRCDYKEITHLPPNGHIESSEILIEQINPTCTSDGYKKFAVYCSTCNEILSTRYEVIDALGHDFIYHERKDPTCIEDGYCEYKTCSRCDYTDFCGIDHLGHKESKGIEIERKECSCVQDGYYVIGTYCASCGELLRKETFVIKSLGGHHYSIISETESEKLFKCIVCGDEYIGCLMLDDLKTSGESDGIDF